MFGGNFNGMQSNQIVSTDLQKAYRTWAFWMPAELDDILRAGRYQVGVPTSRAGEAGRAFLAYIIDLC